MSQALNCLPQCIYQDREELLASDAKQLNLTIVAKDEELDAFVRKTGRKLAPQLQEVLAWTRDRNAPAARVADAHKLLSEVNTLLATAQQKKKLTASEASEAKSLLAEKIRQSVGVRNENLALKVTLCHVELSAFSSLLAMIRFCFSVVRKTYWVSGWECRYSTTFFWVLCYCF